MSGHSERIFSVHRVGYWLLLHVPSGAGWRFSRFRVLRIVGDWWLPRWYGLGIACETVVFPPLEVSPEAAALHELSERGEDEL